MRKEGVRMGKTNLKPAMTVNFKEGCISIGKDAIRALGVPRYISILINEEKKTLAIIPCGEHDSLSFQVPEDLLTDLNKSFRIYSIQFIDGIRGMISAADTRYIRLHGEYDSAMGSVVFYFINSLTE